MPNNYILTSSGSFISEDELYHHGVKGMKWGVRKARIYESKARTARESAKEWNEISKQKSDKLRAKGKIAKASRIEAKYKAHTSKDLADSRKYNQKAKAVTNKGKKKTTKVVASNGSKTVKSLGKAAKTGMSVAQSLWNISDEGARSRQTANYLNMASSMSPEYRRRFMYDW